VATAIASAWAAAAHSRRIDKMYFKIASALVGTSLNSD
jgi:hypothetical protein